MVRRLRIPILTLTVFILFACAAIAETVHVECVCNQLNRVGKEWQFDLTVNGKPAALSGGKYKEGEILTATCAGKDRNVIQLRIIETEKDPSNNDESKLKTYIVSRGETISDEIPVLENAGIYAGRMCVWYVNITVE